MDKKHLFDDPKNIKRLLWVFYVICVGLMGVDLIYHRHVIHDWEAGVFFYAVFGFVACVLLVLVAKEMRKLLMRRDDYYDDE